MFVCTVMLRNSSHVSEWGSVFWVIVTSLVENCCKITTGRVKFSSLQESPPVIAEDIAVDQSILLEEEFRNLLGHRAKQQHHRQKKA